MGSYHWVTAQNVGSPFQTDDPSSAWLTPDDLAIRCLSVPSHGGEGDILVRTEVAVNLIATFQSQGLLELWGESAMSQFIGDVGVHDGETLDPRGDGAYEFAWSWEDQWRWNQILFGDPASDFAVSFQCSTRGYVTSKARRGPDKYGAVDPAFNLSCYTWGSEFYRTGVSGISSSWVITGRCLWFTP